MKFAILTSGGDAPGMNDMVIELLHAASKENHQVYLVNDGYIGLLKNDMSLVTDYHKYDEYSGQAGSFIQCSRCFGFRQDYMQAVKVLQERQIDCLVVIGGNGSYLGARLISQHVPTMFIPGSIDNDVDFSDYALGFGSATEEIIQFANKLKMTFRTHRNIVFLEVMGRFCGDLATAASEVIKPALTITLKTKISTDETVKRLKEYYAKNKYAVVIISEYVYDNDEIKQLIDSIKKEIGCVTRWNVLGYLQRGANVSKKDIEAAKDYAKVAIECMNKNITDVAIVHDKNIVVAKPYTELDDSGVPNKADEVKSDTFYTMDTLIKTKF